MKRQQLAEALYFVVAMALIGICIGSGKTPEKEVFATGVTATPVIEPTKAPELTVGPTSAPVKDTIPAIDGKDTEDSVTTQKPGQGMETDSAQNESPTDVPGNVSEESDGELLPAEEPGRMPGSIKIINENYEEYVNDKKAWWFRRNTGHKPSGSGEEFPIAEYSAYYLDKSVSEEDKVIYLTFDCGYENGFTPSILDTLAEKDVKAMFFVTKDFIAKNPSYVKRMKEEGHLVGNHTVRHLSSPDLTSEELETELYEVAKVMEEETGYTLDPFFRPPMGEYSERTLKVTQDMGYASIFWSIAYYDYNVNDQPGKEYVVDHFNTYHHNGSIVLMHNTSESNAQALGEVVDLLKAAGYRFGMLTELDK